MEVIFDMKIIHKGKRLYIVIGMVAFAVILILIMLLVFRAKNVTVTGCEIVTEEDIKSNYLGGPMGDNTIVIWLKDRLGSFGSIPFIRDTDIDIDFPSEVSIQVYEKALIACFYYMGEYVYFDKDGMILESTTEHNPDIPCIEGISFKGFTMNRKIEVDREGQIDTILDISELISHYKIEVDKVLFNNKNEVTLYCGDIKVFLGRQTLYDQQIASVSDVLRQAKENKIKGTIDMKNYKQGDKIIIRS